MYLYVHAFSFQMNLEPGQEVFEVMIAANKVGLVIGIMYMIVLSYSMHYT
jgi:hypothetical protein